MKLALFDIDGTLTKTISADEICFTRAYQLALGVDKINTDWSVYRHCTDSWIALEIIQDQFQRDPLTGEVAHVKAAYVGQLRQAQARDPDFFLPIPGAREMLEKLLSLKEWAVGIATGGWEPSARFKMKSAGMGDFDIPYSTADDAFSREDILRIAIEKARLAWNRDRFDRIVSIGDGTWDVICARELGIPFLGIADGQQEQRLRELGAEVIVPDYRDLDGFLETLEQVSNLQIPQTKELEP